MWKGMDFQQESAQLLNADFKDLSEAANRLAAHVIKVASVGGFGASFFGFFAAVAAMYVPLSHLSILIYISFPILFIRLDILSHFLFFWNWNELIKC
jgi:hypothetical protein